MAKATSKGQIHDIFFDNLQDVWAQAGQQHQAVRQQGQRPWNVPNLASDTLDVPGITKSFDRTAVDQNYKEVIADGTAPGTIGDAVSLKVQGDHIAIMERGYRARHCTPVRLLAMAAARRKGHGNEAGVFLGGVLSYAQDTLKASQA
jgi:hypothetical protein